MSLLKLGYERTPPLSYEHSAYHPLSWSFWWSQEPCHKLSCGEAHMARNWGSTLVNNLWEIKSCLQQFEGAWKQIHPKMELKTTVAEADTLTKALWGTQRQDPTEPYLIPNPQKLWDNKCCFKSLHCGIICYTAIQKDNPWPLNPFLKLSFIMAIHHNLV